nr:protease Do-like 7 isoform X1 [Tanacetum cinerariifolium]
MTVIQLVVEDLHSITPTYFLEVGGAVLQQGDMVLVEKDPVRRQVLQVQGCLAGSKANKNPIACFNDLDACHALDLLDDMDMIKLNSPSGIRDVKLSFLWEQIQETAVVPHTQSIGAGVLYIILIQQYLP